MTTQIEVRASRKDCSRYKNLVDSDWNKATFDAVLALLWEVISVSASEQTAKEPWLSILREGAEPKHPRGMPEEMSERLRLLSFVFRDPHVPRMPGTIVSGPSKASVQTESTILYLLLQTIVQLKGETGFLQDLQSLLFLNAVHYLLPVLQKSELKTEHASLANAMHVHAFVVWRDQPPHMFYLLGALMGHLGHTRARLEFLERSVSATPIDDHSFLTKANAYWGELLELGERDKAMEFLLKLSRNVPESYLEEIGEMIKETAEMKKAS